MDADGARRSTPETEGGDRPRTAEPAPKPEEIGQYGVGAAIQPVHVATQFLDTQAQITAQAARIKAVAVDSHVMPLGNATHMTDAERRQLGAWIDGGARP